MNFLAQAAWRSITDGGAEQCTLWQHSNGYVVEGLAIRFQSGYWRLDYRVDIDARWWTEQAEVRWQMEKNRGSMQLEHDGDGNWWIDSISAPALDGCRDVDFGFSPVTNLMPVRRLGKDHGSELEVRAAWLQFPGLEVVAAEQTYTRLDVERVGYASNSGYRTELQTSASGFVTHYPELWKPLAV